MLALTIVTGAKSTLASNSTVMSCPPDYSFSIDPPPKPTDDAANPDTHAPQTALEKQQAQDKANADEMSRWHCVPLPAQKE